VFEGKAVMVLPVSRSAQPPGDLDLILRFVNTRVFDADIDELASAQDLTRWLQQAGLLAASETAETADVLRTQAVREALRDAMAVNVGLDPIPDPAVEVLNAAARDARLTTSMTAHGEARLGAQAGGVTGALGTLLTIVVGSMYDGTWKRLKVCAESTCRGAFYDHSRSRSAKWDSMEVCGNRAKQRAWRERHPLDESR
jgi:predicted RNA-binding Zn ribbon-like protein